MFKYVMAILAATAVFAFAGEKTYDMENANHVVMVDNHVPEGCDVPPAAVVPIPKQKCPEPCKYVPCNHVCYPCPPCDCEPFDPTYIEIILEDHETRITNIENIVQIFAVKITSIEDTVEIIINDILIINDKIDCLEAQVEDLNKYKHEHIEVDEPCPDVCPDPCCVVPVPCVPVCPAPCPPVDDCDPCVKGNWRK